jgi:hypothetical protein
VVFLKFSGLFSKSLSFNHILPVLRVYISIQMLETGERGQGNCHSSPCGVSENDTGPGQAVENHRNNSSYSPKSNRDIDSLINTGHCGIYPEADREHGVASMADRGGSASPVCP